MPRTTRGYVATGVAEGPIILSMQVESLDHIVLTVASIGRAIVFYERVLGFEAREFKPGRFSFHFGQQKINLHEVGTVVD